MVRLSTYLLATAFLLACGDDSSSPADASVDVLADAANTDADASADTADVSDTDSDTADTEPGVTAPDRVPRFPDALPFEVTRAVPFGESPDAAEMEAFSVRMRDFYTGTDFIRWTRAISHGVAEDNPWDEPSYLFWWQGVYVVKEDDVVTFVHEGGADNMMSHHGRVFGSVVGAWLTLPDTDDGDLRALLLGYIRGVSATMTGSIWGDEDPVVDTIMARAIFHRNHTWELSGGRVAAVNYDEERQEIIQRRHDTLHNPNNPTWGDIWVRNKRSKDDFPWVYRMQAHLARLLWTTDDEEIREAALTLFDQLHALAGDIFEHGYIIRAKDENGEPYIPYLTEDEDVVDDFASMVEFEEFLPNAECNAKLPVALIATGEPQGNDCGDGRLTGYEELVLARFYGHTWMQWNFHMGSFVTALLYGEHDMARALLEGFGARLDALHERDDPISDDPRFLPDLAQTLVLAATWGLPLTGDEADLVIEHYTRAAAFFEEWELWDPWRDDVADGTYPYLPGRSHEDDERDQIHIEDFTNLLEYCASPLRATEGAQFIDCAVFTDASAWR